MKLAIVICLNIIYATISESNFNNENRTGTRRILMSVHMWTKKETQQTIKEFEEWAKIFKGL